MTHHEPMSPSPRNDQLAKIWVFTPTAQVATTSQPLNHVP